MAGFLIVRSVNGVGDFKQVLIHSIAALVMIPNSFFLF
jgi:hypothetical protein